MVEVTNMNLIQITTKYGKHLQLEQDENLEVRSISHFQNSEDKKNNNVRIMTVGKFMELWNGDTKQKRFSIPCLIYEGKEIDMEINPYVIGILLGDGYISSDSEFSSTRKTPIGVSISFV